MATTSSPRPSSSSSSSAPSSSTDNNKTGGSNSNGTGATNPPPNSDAILNVNVGVLGHVDSGKTSLVKTLSTLLSTAALDKSKQSRQRGMTLDLGFSCFFVDMPTQLQTLYPTKTTLQITLVDCPGHASLIRTIIGGAQIIDMVLLVVDAYKGWQAQTTECLVLAELTSPHLVVALNKIDLFPEKERQERIELVKKDIRQRLAKTKFVVTKENNNNNGAECYYPPMIGVAACIGGEKVAAATGEKESASNNNNNNNTTSLSALDSNAIETSNVDTLIQVIKDTLPPPKRDNHNNNKKNNSNNNNKSNNNSKNKDGNTASAAPFYFSIDHCFPIKGMGTVLTGTVLNGTIKVNDVIEFPTLGLERKIKSMQMFKKKTKSISQGDRAGICVSSLDAKLLERGVAATPKSVQYLNAAIALVRKIPYFPNPLTCNSKFHISVGHTTIMATVTFFGARELYNQQQQQNSESNNGTAETTATNTTTNTATASSLGGDANRAGLPFLKFDFNQSFLLQDGYLESLEQDGNTTATTNNNNNKNQQPLLHWALLEFQTPVYCPLDSLIIGSRLDTVENKNISNKFDDSSSSSSCRLAFSGRLLQKIDPAKQEEKNIKLYTPKQKQGVISRLGELHKRQDDGQLVRYEVFGSDLFKKETNMKPFVGMKIVTAKGNNVGEIKSSFGTSGKFRVFFPAGIVNAKEGDILYLPFKRYLHDPEKAMRQDDIQLPPARVGSRVETQNDDNNKNVHQKKKKQKPEKIGQIHLVKGDVMDANTDDNSNNKKYPIAIITGFFSPDVNIKERAGQRVYIPSTKEEGKIVGPFGKAGKCKVSFESGVSAAVGAKAELHYPIPTV